MSKSRAVFFLDSHCGIYAAGGGKDDILCVTHHMHFDGYYTGEVVDIPKINEWTRITKINCGSYHCLVLNAKNKLYS